MKENACFLLNSHTLRARPTGQSGICFLTQRQVRLIRGSWQVDLARLSKLEILSADVQGLEVQRLFILFY